MTKPKASNSTCVDRSVLSLAGQSADQQPIPTMPQAYASASRPQWAPPAARPFSGPGLARPVLQPLWPLSVRPLYMLCVQANSLGVPVVTACHGGRGTPCPAQPGTLHPPQLPCKAISRSTSAPALVPFGLYPEECTPRAEMLAPVEHLGTILPQQTSVERDPGPALLESPPGEQKPMISS